jgi:hypothetical protein
MTSEKFCQKCRTAKPLSDFHKSRSAADGFQGRCKKCISDWYEENKLRVRAQKAEWYKDPENRRRQREIQLRRRFGISTEKYEELLLKQSGVCAICKKLEELDRSLAVDHDHKTGRIRGLLCTKCNTAIGLLNEDPVVLVNAQKYLQE